MKNIILDCDFNEQSKNILTLLCNAENCRVVGISAGTGAKQAKEAAEELGLSVPIAKGYHNSILGRTNYSAFEENSEFITAAELYKNLTSDGPVEILATGTLTALAISILSNLKMVENIQKIHVCAGALQTGDLSIAVDKKIAADPEAAHIVFQSGAKLFWYPMDVANTLTEPEKLGVLGCLESDAITYKTGYVQIDLVGLVNRGRCVADIRTGWAKALRKGKPETQIAVKVNMDLVK